jgi:hypothetical protein
MCHYHNLNFGSCVAVVTIEAALQKTYADCAKDIINFLQSAVVIDLVMIKIWL